MHVKPKQFLSIEDKKWGWKPNNYETKIVDGTVDVPTSQAMLRSLYIAFHPCLSCYTTLC